MASSGSGSSWQRYQPGRLFTDAHPRHPSIHPNQCTRLLQLQRAPPVDLLTRAGVLVVG
jgi:hypothetical protein